MYLITNAIYDLLGIDTLFFFYTDQIQPNILWRRLNHKFLFAGEYTIPLSEIRSAKDHADKFFHVCHIFHSIQFCFLNFFFQHNLLID